MLMAIVSLARWRSSFSPAYRRWPHPGKIVTSRCPVSRRHRLSTRDQTIIQTRPHRITRNPPAADGLGVIDGIGKRYLRRSPTALLAVEVVPSFLVEPLLIL